MSTFQDLSEEGKAALRREFEDNATSRERRIAILTLVREGADEAQISRRCPVCKHFPFYAPHDEALIEGHVYSHDGMAEIGITGYCEFCFDKITAEEPEENEDAWKQRAIADDIEFMAKSMSPGTTVRRLSDEEVREMFKEEGEE